LNKQRIAYVVFPFLSMVLALFICYWLNQKYAEANGIVGVDYSFVFRSFNDAVPFWSWTVYPYVMAFVFWPFAFFYIGYRSKEGLYKILLVGLVTFAIFGIWYFFFQSDVQAWRETSGLFDPTRTDFTFTERFMKLIYDSAGPRNALPSTHCLMCWIAICGVRMDKKMPIPAKIGIWTMSLIIMFATQTTKQHYIIDLIVAVVICEIVFQIVQHTNSWMKLRDAYSKLNRRLGMDWDGITE
jgi:hypothetical protein